MHLYNVKYSIIMLCAVILLLNNTLGFDLYAHAIMYYYLDTMGITTYNFFDTFILPRYFLLSYIYEIATFIGIPIGYVAILLIVYPMHYILKSLLLGARIENKIISISFSSASLLFVSYILIFLYSSLTMVMLWLIAFSLSGRKIFILGALFHPIGSIFYILYFISNKFKNIKFFIYILSSFLLFNYLDSKFFHFFIQSSINNASLILFINFDVPEKIINNILMKSYLLYNLIFMAVIVYFLINIKKVLYIKYVNISMYLLLFTIFVTMYMSSKKTPTAITYYFNINDYNYAADATWVDWGSQDISVSYSEMFYSKLKYIRE